MALRMADLLDEAEQTEPPVSLELVGSFLHVKHIRRVVMASAARLSPNYDHLVIEVNADHPVGRQRFSIAHDLAHVVSPDYSRGYIDDRVTGQFSEKSELELLCDIGAAALLMDERWLRKATDGIQPSIAELVHLSGLFGVSIEAMAVRISELNLWPCSFVFWEEGLRKSERVHPGQGHLEGFEESLPEPKPRVQRAYSSTAFNVFIPKNKSAPKGSTVAECFRTHESNRGYDAFPFGRGMTKAYCENYFAPYRLGGTLTSRVITLMMPTYLAETESKPPARMTLAQPTLSASLEVDY